MEDWVVGRGRWVVREDLKKPLLTAHNAERDERRKAERCKFSMQSAGDLVD